jgi:hypothetical protein
MGPWEIEWSIWLGSELPQIEFGGVMARPNRSQASQGKASGAGLVVWEPPDILFAGNWLN